MWPSGSQLVGVALCVGVAVERQRCVEVAVVGVAAGEGVLPWLVVPGAHPHFAGGRVGPVALVTRGWLQGAGGGDDRSEGVERGGGVDCACGEVLQGDDVVVLI